MNDPIGDYIRREMDAAVDDLGPFVSGPPSEMPVTKLGAWMPVSHELLCDYTDHVCTADCPPPYVVQQVPFWRRVRYAVARAKRAVTGLRVVYKDRIRDEGE